MANRPALLRLQPSSLVGRDEDLAALDELWSSTLEGHPTAALIGGDAGIGKTSLVDAFVERHRAEALVVRGSCVPLGGDGLAYVPIVSLLRELQLAVGTDTVMEWAGPRASALGSLLPGVAPSTATVVEPSLTLEATTDILERAARRQPLVVVVEDLHWADTSTRDVLAFVIRGLRSVPLLIVGTYRSDELHRRHPLRPFLAELDRLPHVARLALDRLDRRAVGAMLEQLLPDRPDEADIEEIFERSDGNPFFVEELAGTDCCNLPEGLRDVLLVRFETLGATAQATVRLAAVDGNRPDHGLLEIVGELPPAELAAAVREALDAQLLVTDQDGYRFRHALLREAVLADLLPGEAAALHRRFAHTLELKDDLLPEAVRAVRLSNHWYYGNEPEKAFRWSIAAGRVAGIGPSEALCRYERALDLWATVADPEGVAGASRADVLTEAAHLANAAGDLARSLALTEAALAEVDRRAAPAQTADLLMRKGRLLTNLIRPGGVATLEEAAALVPDEPPSALRADVLAMLAATQMMSGDEAMAIDTATAAIAAAEAADATIEAAHAYITRGTSAGGLGRIDAALDDFDKARRLCDHDEQTIVRWHINLSDTLRVNGRFEDAAREASAAVAIARSLGRERTWGAMLAGNAAEPLLQLGRWDEAVALIDQALELNPPASHRLHLRVLRAIHATWTGDFALADRLLAEFRHQFATLRTTPQYLELTSDADVAYALATGDHRRAWAVAGPVLDDRRCIKPSAAWWLAAKAAQALAELRDSGDTSVDVAAAESLLRRVTTELGDTVPGQAAAASAVIEAELTADAAAWTRAADALEAVEGPVHLRPYAALRLAEVLVPADRRRAAELARGAADAARRLGARPLLARIEQFARRLGEPIPGSGDATAGPAAASPLTPRELDVLRLVADGLSNGEIGQRLFISTKTASVHVSNILAKLGVANRTEAAATAQRDALI